MLRVGVVGTGSMGQNHARVYAEMAELVGVFDAVKEQARSVAQRHSVQAFDELEHLIDQVDAAWKATGGPGKTRVAGRPG